MPQFIVVPDADVIDGNLTTLAHAQVFDGTSLSGLSNGTGYRAYVMSTVSPLILPASMRSANRIAQITTSPQGRLNVVPASFFAAGQDELIDPNEHPMIMGVTHLSLRSGNFSDPTLWSTGTVPGAGSVWRIASPHTVIYDLERNVIMKDGLVSMGATLKWANNRDTRMRIDFFMAMGTIDMTDPNESATFGKARHEVIFHASQAPGATARLGFMPMGPARIHGAKKAAHLRVALTGVQTVPAVLAGATQIRLTGLAQAAWRVGDVLHIVGTEYLLPATSDPQYTGPSTYYNPSQGVGGPQITMNQFQFGQDEERTITAIAGDTVTLNAPLAFNHIGTTGTLHDGKVITMAPVVMNMSRSILFRSASAAEDGAIDPGADITNLQKRAHMMFMRHSDVDTRYFALKNMGRSSNDPTLFVAGLPYWAASAGGNTFVEPLRASLNGALLANPENVTGRWALHYHWCGGPYAAAPQINCIGAVVYAPIGGVPTPGWAIAHHGSRMAIEDCNVSNFRGAGIVAEQGTEIGQWVNNCVTGGRGDGDRGSWGSRSELWNKHHGSAGIAYECQSRSVILHDNIAGSCRAAYQWHASKSVQFTRSPRDVDMRLVDGLTMVFMTPSQAVDTDAYGAINAQIPPFLGNEAWACRFGLQVIHRQGEARHRDKTPMLVEDFHCANVPFPMNVPEYSNSYYFKDCFWQGPLNMMGGQTSVAAVLGTVTWDWNFANIHMRNYQVGFADFGAGLNYEGHFIDCTFENVANPEQTGFRTISGTHATRDVMGPWTVNPANPGQWKIRRYASESSANLPTPYPLAPYGRKLPAGHPPVPIGATPYFVLGDGTNGAASAGLNLTLTAGGGRGQGALFGIIRDSVGDRRYPDWQSSESYPSNVSIKTTRSLEKGQPEQLVQRNGCWLDGAVWKTRTHHFGADRFTHARFVFHVDWTLANFPAAFLAAHDIGGAPVAPVWPDQLEVVPPVQPPLVRLVKPLRFLSRTRAEAVAGLVLNHRLRPNEVSTMLSIVGGADAARFQISGQSLQWAGNGVRALDASDANGDNRYEVRIRAVDAYGNMVEQDHQIVMVSGARHAPLISDTFDRAGQNLVANPAYLLLGGAADALRIANNRVENFQAGGAPATVSFGSLGTSEQSVSFSFPDWGRCSLLFRMVDANNWLSVFRNDASNRLELNMMLGGVFSSIARFANFGSGVLTLTVRDRRFNMSRASNEANGPHHQYPNAYVSAAPLEMDPHTSTGVILLPENAPRGVEVGVRSAGNTGGALDNFSARAL